MYLPVKVDSRTATGVEGGGSCSKNEANRKDAEEDNRKTKIPGPPAHIYSTWENDKKTASTSLFFSKQNVN